MFESLMHEPPPNLVAWAVDFCTNVPGTADAPGMFAQALDGINVELRGLPASLQKELRNHVYTPVVLTQFGQSTAG
jgi:hypothetical protein